MNGLKYTYVAYYHCIPTKSGVLPYKCYILKDTDTIINILKGGDRLELKNYLRYDKQIFKKRKSGGNSPDNSFFIKKIEKEGIFCKEDGRILEEGEIEINIDKVELINYLNV